MSYQKIPRWAGNFNRIQNNTTNLHKHRDGQKRNRADKVSPQQLSP